ncbi:MAG TPA: transglycosylase domain-containing protein, partial [Egibacteraceae bacterium]|nr:transglycosylase domain-containing protein [Egibacteraceae bacterium]
MSWTRFSLRAAAAAIVLVVLSFAMVLTFAMVALAIDWDIPEAQGELLGPSSVFDRNLVPITRFAAEIEARPVPLEEVAESIQLAVIAAEDHRFYEHEGVDALSVIRAVVRNLQTGAIAEGGSTLTQQYVKNVYVGDAVTWSRKIREAVVALQLEKELEKEEILERYLNRAYFGAGAYGVEAAAQTYFEKPASDLTIAEAATLAQTLAAPTRYSPRNDPGRALQRRNRVIDLMRDYGFVTRQEAGEARIASLGIIEPRIPEPPAPFFVEQVRQHMLAAYGPDLVYRGGLHIITTIDLEQQAKLDQQIRERLPADPGLDMGAVAVDPRNGDIIAAYSGRDFKASQVDLAMGSDFGQQTGSAFKPVPLAAVLERGKELSSVYRAPGSITIGGTTVRGSGCGGGCSLLRAIAASSNTVFFQVGNEVGVEAMVEMAHRLGMRSPDLVREGPNAHGIGMALGTADVTPLDMASAFGTFANMGVACPARTVLEVRNPAGTPLAPPDPRQPTEEQLAAWTQRMAEFGYELGPEDLGRCYRAIAPSVAGKVNEGLQAVVASGTGRSANIGRPQAGKTGTSQESKQLWYSGYTPELSLAIYVGDPRTPRTIRGLPGCRGQCFGGGVVAPIWAAAASALLEGVEPTEFPETPPDERKVRSESGRRLGPPMASPAPSPEPTPEPLPTFSPAPPPTVRPIPWPTATPSPLSSPEPPPAPGDPGDPGGGGVARGG